MKLIRVVQSLLLFSSSTFAFSQNGSPLPQETFDRTRDSSTSDTTVYDRENQFKSKYNNERDKRAQLEAELLELRKNWKVGPSNVTAAPAGVATSPAGSPSINQTAAVQPNSSVERKENAQVEEELKALRQGSASKSENDAPLKTSRSGGSVRNATLKKGKPGTQPFPRSQGTFNQGLAPASYTPPLVFSVSAMTQSKLDDKKSTVIPKGSYVKARVLTGAEANTLEPYPLLLQLDYAMVGPNKTRIDMTGCFLIAKAKANLSTERVMGETTDLSCVRDDGEHVERPAKGYLAGEDSTVGIAGQLISKQGQVLLAAVLSNLAKGAGEAVAMANSTTQAISGVGGAVEKTTKVTGSTAAYVGGKAVTGAAETIANWYLDYARQLMPSIAVGSGRDIWVVLLETVKIPPLATE